MVTVTVTTRSGRQVKKPDVYTPAEVVLVDDFNQSEYDSDDSGGDSIDSESGSDSDSSEEGSDSEMKDFIVDDDDEDEEDEDEEESA
jgi:hypothetical protein